MEISQFKVIPKPDQKVMKKLMYHHITRRTWAEKTAKNTLRAKIWIAKYFLDRKQRVKAGETTAWKDVEAGVIQGSVLGPIYNKQQYQELRSKVPVANKMVNGQTKKHKLNI